MEKAALTVIFSPLIAHDSFTKSLDFSKELSGTVSHVVWDVRSCWHRVPARCLTPEILPVVEPAELWEQRFAASALLWERSLLLGPKPSERRRHSNTHLLSVCNTGESGILFQLSWKACPLVHRQQYPLLSIPAVPILMQSALDTCLNSVP